MLRRFVSTLVVLAMPAAASPGTLRDAAERAAREHTAAPSEDDRSRPRFWTGVALIAAGGALAALSGVELREDETGPDDGEDLNDSDDGEDSDGWGNKALLGGGVAAATVGGVLLLTGRRGSGPVVSLRRSGVLVRQTVRF